MLAIIKANLHKAQLCMKNQADKRRKDLIFEEGALLLLRLQPYRQLSIHRRSSQKLSLRFYGPFKVLERIGNVAYRLQLPPGSRVHPVFHISLLKPFHSNTPYTLHPVPPSVVELQPVHHPIALLDRRTIRRNGKKVFQVLLQWSDMSPEDSTWEDESLMDSLSTANVSASSMITAVPDKDFSSSLSVGNITAVHSKAISSSSPFIKSNIEDDVTSPEGANVGPNKRPKRVIHYPKHLEDYVIGP